jgi:SOS-response transcriptional repressor LexA
VLDGTNGEVFKFIQQFMAIHKFAPSLSEIADGCRISTSTAHKALELLEKRGYLERQKGMQRSITILKAG